MAKLELTTGTVLTSTDAVSEAELQTAYEAWRNGWQDVSFNSAGQQAQRRAEEEAASMGRFARIASRALDVRTTERAWRLGAEGERLVGRRLEKLKRQGYRVLHAVPVGTRGSDIDHLLIGPAGVFTVNSKNHPGATIWVRNDTVKVNGHNQPYVRNAGYEASRAQQCLTAGLGWMPPVAGIVVVIARNLTVKEQLVPGVAVIESSMVPRWFKRLPQRLTPEHVDQIYAVARRSTTWGAAPA